MSKQISKLSDLKKPQPLLVSINEGIIKVTGQTLKTYVGYNIFTETLIEVEKEKCSKIPDWILELLNNRKNRLELALQLVEDYSPSKAAKLIDVGERELYRYKKSKLIEE